VIAQDELSSVVYGMPKAAHDAGLVDSVLPLSSIASRLIERVETTCDGSSR
jgi:two-component system chemotaxis response regulator CheB